MLTLLLLLRSPLLFLLYESKGRQDLHLEELRVPLGPPIKDVLLPNSAPPSLPLESVGSSIDATLLLG